MNWRIFFSGSTSPAWVLFVLAAITASALFTLSSLRWERRLVSASVIRALTGLRFLILLCLLAVLLKPVLTNRPDTSQNGRLVILTDTSLSMQTSDRHASHEEKIRWGTAMHMLKQRSEIDNSNSSSQQTLDSMDPASPSQNRGNSPLQPSAAQRELMNSTAAAVADMTRLEIARQLLYSGEQPLLEQLAQSWNVDLRAFAGATAEISKDQFQPDSSFRTPDLRASHTDLLDSIQRLMSESAANDLKAILVFSDGQQTESGDLREVAARLASLGIPVFTVPLGSSRAPRDLSIISVNAPESVFLHDSASVRVLLATSGFQGQELAVSLQQNGQEIEQKTIVPTTSQTEVAFSVTPETAANQEYTIHISNEPGETRDDNNDAQFLIQVVDAAARVMLVEGDARWEFRYLKNLFERDEQVLTESILLHQPWLKILTEPGFTAELPAADQFREALANTDILFLGDVAPEDIAPNSVTMIEQAVSQDGLTLVCIPGHQSMPWRWPAESDLSKLLPVADTRQKTAEDYQQSRPELPPSSYRMLLAPSAADLPMFRGLTGTDLRTSMDQLPGPPWIATGTPKPGAMAWLSTTLPRPNTSPDPVIVHQDYGFGQVLWMGMDSTWRWRKRAGDEIHYRFWGQLVRWASRTRAAAGNSDVKFSLSRSVVPEGSPLNATVRWNQRLIRQLESTQVELLLEPQSASSEGQRPSGNQTVRLVSTPEKPGYFSTQIAGLSPGVWRARLQLQSAPVDVPAIETEFVVTQQRSAELARIACDRSFLRDLAVASGGMLIETDQIDELQTLLAPETAESSDYVETTLWDHWSVLLIFGSLLTAEWIIRRVSGLP